MKEKQKERKKEKKRQAEAGVVPSSSLLKLCDQELYFSGWVGGELEIKFNLSQS